MTEQMPFHSTPIGRTYYEETLPNLIKAMNRLATTLEKKAQHHGKCHWLGCEEPGKPSFISLPGGSALKVCLCEKHTKRVVKVLGSSIVIVRPPGQKEIPKKCPTCGLPKDLCVCSEFKKEEQRIPTPPESLTEAEKKIVERANEKLRAKVTPAAKDDEATKSLSEEERKKKEAELGTNAMVLGRLDVETADLENKLATKRQMRITLERRGEILAKLLYPGEERALPTLPEAANHRKEEEKKKKEDEFEKIAIELNRINVEIADLKKATAIKEKTRAILVKKSRILASEISDEATNRG